MNNVVHGWMVMSDGNSSRRITASRVILFEFQRVVIAREDKGREGPESSFHFFPLLDSDYRTSRTGRK